jgi:hypothetical protein
MSNARHQTTCMETMTTFGGKAVLGHLNRFHTNRAFVNSVSAHFKFLLQINSIGFGFFKSGMLLLFYTLTINWKKHFNFF